VSEIQNKTKKKKERKRKEKKKETRLLMKRRKTIKMSCERRSFSALNFIGKGV